VLEATVTGQLEISSKKPKMAEELGLTPSVMKVPTPEQRAAFTARNLARANGPKDAEWQLLYWPSLLGRGEYVRLVLVEAGQDWHEVALEEGVLHSAMRKQGCLRACRVCKKL